MAIQINLMSRELLPNVIPTLSQGVNTIDKIYLVLAGKGFENSAFLLKDFYQKKGVKEVEIYHCADAHDYYELRSKANKLYKAIKSTYADKQIVLNATAGTKPMAFAFTQAFDHLQENSMVLYTDTLNKRVIILSDAENLPNLPYLSVLNIEEYFALYGFTVDDSISSADYADDLVFENKDLSLYYLQTAQQNRRSASIINGMAQKTGFSLSCKNAFVAQIEFSGHIPREVKQILKTAQSADLIALSDDGITFNDQEAARYLGGGWIEEVIYIAAREVGIEHVGLNVVGYQAARGTADRVKNELDVVLVHNNQILIIEAKTLNWQTPSNVSKGQASILKLDSLTNNFGGAYAQGMIMSLFPFTDSMTNRTENLRNLSLVQIQSYEQLIAIFEKWKKSTV